MKYIITKKESKIISIQEINFEIENLPDNAIIIESDLEGLEILKNYKLNAEGIEIEPKSDADKQAEQQQRNLQQAKADNLQARNEWVARVEQKLSEDLKNGLSRTKPKLAGEYAALKSNYALTGLMPADFPTNAEDTESVQWWAENYPNLFEWFMANMQSLGLIPPLIE